MLVSALLIVINFTSAAEFPWSAFAVGGMTIGLLAHWWFGYRNLETELTARQHKVEERAAHLRWVTTHRRKGPAHAEQVRVR
jgi:hypothetical protein